MKKKTNLVLIKPQKDFFYNQLTCVIIHFLLRVNFYRRANFSYQLCLVPRMLQSKDGSNPRSDDVTTFGRPKLTTETQILVCKS